MKNHDEYLRLPHGMFDREENWVERERKILDYHAKSGKSIGCKVKKYSPLSYYSTFIRGANTAKNKVYTFNSKSGKSLILSSDSTPSVFREYVANNNGEAKRIAFVAPLFRYRNSHSRHFTQIGYSIINEKKSKDEELDLALIQLAKAMIDLFSKSSIKTKICINDYGALRTILGRYISQDELGNFLYQLQFASTEERLNKLKTIITDEHTYEELAILFTQEPRKVEYEDKKENRLNLPQEYRRIYKMAKGLSYITGVEVYFTPSDLHSIETIDNFALRFRTLDDIALGDGGEYTNYAKRWNDKIQTFWSVASGVEAIERNSPKIELDEIKKKIALCNLDASPDFILKTLKQLEEMGEFSVAYVGEIKNVGKAMKKLKNDYTHIAVLGNREENGEDINIRSLQNEETRKIKSSNYKDKNQSQDIDFDER